MFRFNEKPNKAQIYDERKNKMQNNRMKEL